MASRTGRLRALLKGPHGRRLVKFAAVSVVSTLCTQVVFAVAYDAVSLGTAIECNVLATAVSTLPAYWLNRTWTWGKRGRSHLGREVLPFWVISFVGLVLSTVAVGLAAHNANGLFASHIARRVFVQSANIATYALIWVARYVIFNRFLFGEKTTASRLPVPGEVEAIVLEEHGRDPLGVSDVDAVREAGDAMAVPQSPG